MDIDALLAFEFATYELLLDTSEQETSKIKIAQVGVGERFSMQCHVIGEVHNSPELTWIKDGSELASNDSVNITDLPRRDGTLRKSIEFSSFNAAKHSGVYECSVRRKDDKYHTRRMRLEQKLGNAQIADGFAACPSQYHGTCHNDGFCMIHKASESISCLCPNDSRGPRCENLVKNDAHRVPAAVATELWAMSAVILSCLILLIFCCCYSMKQRRHVQRLRTNAKKTRSISFPEPESRPLNCANNRQNSEVLATQQSTEMRDEAYCWSCGSSQLHRSRPPVAMQNALRRAEFFRDIKKPDESVCSITTNESNELPNGR